VRRLGPAPAADALREAVAEVAPDTLLARVQRLWGEVAGPAVAAEAEPVGEQNGTVTVECAGAVWAHELTLLGPELVAALNARLGGFNLTGLRFTVKAQ
jgi:predicted nucleic acid-binding Zn ribbon protein